MVSAEQTQIYWALVERGEITQVVDGLLSRWRNIGAMHRLRIDELRDLSWAGHGGAGWLPVRWERPAFDERSEYLEGPRFRVDGDEVIAEFDVLPMPRPDLDILRGIPITIIRPKESGEATRA